MDVQILAVAYAIITGLLGVLLMLIGWLGKMTMLKIDKLTDSIDNLGQDLHHRINEHDKRITRAEMHIDHMRILK